MKTLMKPFLLAASVASCVALTGCAGSSDDAVNASSPSSAPTPSNANPSQSATVPSSVAPTTLAVEGVETVYYTCYVGSGSNQKNQKMIVDPKDGQLDFSKLWAQNPHGCENFIGGGYAKTAVEQAAYAASGYDNGGDISTLYKICADNDPDNVKARPGYALSSDQAKEVQAALMICPAHPQAGLWLAAAGVGADRAELEASGQRFGSGTHLVNTEISPGIYAIDGEIEGCYWSRQDSSGDTIENDFVPNARRVQVTIAAEDYAFDSRGCGTWTPAP